MSPETMSHVAHIDESCHTYEGVMSLETNEFTLLLTGLESGDTCE